MSTSWLYMVCGLISQIFRVMDVLCCIVDMVFMQNS